MADAQAFEAICTQIEGRTSLDRLAARGTVRIALKQAGLEASSVSPEQMAVVAEKLLAAELTTRGVADAATVCAELAAKLRSMKSTGKSDTPDAVFGRLGG